MAIISCLFLLPGIAFVFVGVAEGAVNSGIKSGDGWKDLLRLSVSMPDRYTAMENDIEVTFDLRRPNAFAHNAMVHLEYIEAATAEAGTKKLASLPVPLGITSGTVVFQCGTIKHAGPHRAFLTVNGQRRAESEVLQVSWPRMSVTVPKNLETYSSDVSVAVSFTRSLCSTFTTFGDWGMEASPFFGRKNPKLGFSSRLDLVQCSKDLPGDGEDDPEHVDCQAPSQPDDGRIWMSHPVENLYLRPSFAVNLNCSVWSSSGVFRLFLRTNLSHAAVIARSPAVSVSVNREYSVSSPEADFVLPCLREDVKPVFVRRPKCAANNDKIRVYGQGKITHARDLLKRAAGERDEL